MRILVDASALRFAGGRRLGIGFVRELGRLTEPLDHAVVCAPPDSGYEEIASNSIDLRIVPSMFFGPGMRLVRERWVVHQVNAVRPDVVFNMSDIALPISCKQLLLFHWAYAVYPDSGVWKSMNWRNLAWCYIRRSLLNRRLGYATALTVQTENIAQRVRKHLKFRGPVHVVPNAVGIETEQELRENAPLHAIQEAFSRGDRNLLYLCRYYVHKNLEILLKVAELVKENQLSYRIITTVAADQSQGAKDFLQTIERDSLDQVIINIGPVTSEQVPFLYQEADGVLIPTLLESYGLTYFEAMHYGCPIFTSDRDFARVVCRDSAFYFDPHDAHAILQTIERAFANQAEIGHKLKIGRNIFKTTPAWPAVAQEYLDIMRGLLV